MSSSSSAWTFLVLSGLADVVWAVATKYSDGFSRPGWTLVSLASLVVFVGLLTQALKVLPLGVAYAVWTGIGAAGSVVAGLMVFGEALSAGRAGAVIAIVGGGVALKLLPA